MKTRRSLWMSLFLLALLLAGSGAHVWHHVLDPHCEESGAAGESHPCLACAALHGATIAEIGVGVAPPIAAQRDLRAARAHDAPRPAARGIVATRAPPEA